MVLKIETASFSSRQGDTPVHLQRTEGRDLPGRLQGARRPRREGPQGG